MLSLYERSIMDNNTTTNGALINSTNNTTKAKDCRVVFIVIIAILSLALIGSICFCLISLNSQKDEISRLNHLLNSQSPAQDTTLEIEEDKEIDAPTETNNIAAQSSQSGPYIANNFLFIPEWGVKFQLSDKLTDYGYAVAQDSASTSYGPYQIGLTAVQSSDLISHPQSQYYDDIFSCSMVTISKTDKDMSNVTGPRAVIPYNNSSLVIYDYNGNTHCNFDLNKAQVINQLVEIVSHPLAI